MNKLKTVICAMTLPAGLMLGATAASADDGSWIVGCCLSPNPIQCWMEGGQASVQMPDKMKKSLVERIEKLQAAGGFKEAQASKAELGLARGPYSSSCSPKEVVSLFEKRLPLREIQAHCEIKSTKIKATKK